MEIKEIENILLLQHTIELSELPKKTKTLLFTQAKRNNLTIEQVKLLINTMEKQIEKEEKENQKEWQKVDFTCNI